MCFCHDTMLAEIKKSSQQEPIHGLGPLLASA